MRQVVVTMAGIMAILWGGLLALYSLAWLAFAGDPFGFVFFSMGALIAAVGIVAIRRWG